MGFVFLRKLLKNWKRKSKCFWCMALCWNPFLSHQAEQQTGTHPSTQVLIQNDFLLPWHLRILQLSEGQLWVLCSDSIFHTPFSIFHIPYPTWRQDNHLFAKWSSHTLRSVQTPVALFLSWASLSLTPLEFSHWHLCHQISHSKSMPGPQGCAKGSRWSLLMRSESRSLTTSAKQINLWGGS